MRGTFDQFRAAHPGKWLLIRTDGRDSETGTLFFADENPNRADEALLRQPKELDKGQPLYATYSETEEDKDLLFIL